MKSIQDILNNYANFNINRLDLELLLAFILDCDRTFFYSHPEQQIADTKFRNLKALMQKRKKGIPLAYLTNKKAFYNLEFYVDERVLIPRPETEQIVSTALELHPTSLLDIGTGSGAIALSLKHNSPQTAVTALDISTEALEVAKQNSENLKLVIKLLESDLLQVIPQQSHFDIITANLPYIGVSKNACVSQETHNNEPHTALFSGHDGLDLYRRLLEELKAKEISFKYLIGEFGFGQEKDIIEMLKDYDFEIKNDLAGIPRIFIISN